MIATLKNLDSKVFADLSLEEGSAIVGGRLVESGRYKFDSNYTNPRTFQNARGSKLEIVTNSTAGPGNREFALTLQRHIGNGVFEDYDTKVVDIGPGISTIFTGLNLGDTFRLKFIDGGGFDGNIVAGNFDAYD